MVSCTPCMQLDPHLPVRTESQHGKQKSADQDIDGH